MFSTYGSVELYLLYKLSEQIGDDNDAGTKDAGAYSVGGKFE